MMDFTTLVQKRHSTRDFTEQIIPRSQLDQIIQDALTTPSWVNSQPWRVYVATGNTLALIKEKHREAVDQGDFGRPEYPVLSRDKWDDRSQANMATWTTEFKQRFKPGEVDFRKSQADLFNAQALIYITLPKDLSLWSVHDIGAFTQTLVLSATAQGLASITAYELVKFPTLVKEIMEIPSSETLAVGVALGYASTDPLNSFSPNKLTLEQVATFKD